MRPTAGYELPPEREAVARRAARYEVATLAYLVSVVVLLYFVLGSSQAMKTAWLEDLLSLVPPAVFLVAYRVRRMRPDERWPYGHHRVVTIAFLCASLALFAMGAFLLGDAVVQLVRREHPTIGAVNLFGRPVWLGWLMLPALAWSAVPAIFLGRAKLPLARALHDKVLFADAQMNKADWMTATAAMAGVLGIACGLWWADAAVAAVISGSILWDGWSNLTAAVADLMDRRPETVGHEAADPLTARLATELEKLEWVAEARVRLREAGHVFFGEAFVVPRDERDLVERIERAVAMAYALDWRLHDLVIHPVRSVEGPTGRRVDGG